MAMAMDKSDELNTPLDARKPSRRVTKRNVPMPSPSAVPMSIFPLYSTEPDVLAMRPTDSSRHKQAHIMSRRVHNHAGLV
jgi:hypothetical protein